MPRPRPASMQRLPRHGLARVLSKYGLCSRSEATAWVRAGRVTVNDHVVRDAEFPIDADRDRISLDGHQVAAHERIYVMLNKPRGLVTTASDEQSRATVYSLLEGHDLPWLAPVGRLDRASEGLLLMTNDSVWAAGITEPASSVSKTYHVQIDRVPDQKLLDEIRLGVSDRNERLDASYVRELRRGEKNAWLEIILDEGKNRHIRRLLAVFDIAVLRLIRVAIGPLILGDLGKGQWRRLSNGEAAVLANLSS
ncbi:MAG: pseudouridine synthase [Dokdonella sp.]